MRLLKLTFLFLILFLCISKSSRAVWAAPHFTLSPVNGSYASGNTFTVMVGVDTGTEKSAAMDVWAQFNQSKIEVVSITKATTPAFEFDTDPVIDNANGKFHFSCSPKDSESLLNAGVVKGDLALVTFRVKAAGSSTLTYICTSGLTTDSNILTPESVDVINCSENMSGNYTLTAGSGGTEVNPTPTPTSGAGSGATATPTTKVELPKTGNVSSTLGLMIFGIVSVGSALFLRWL